MNAKHSEDANIHLMKYDPIGHSRSREIVLVFVNKTNNLCIVFSPIWLIDFESNKYLSQYMENNTKFRNQRSLTCNKGCFSIINSLLVKSFIFLLSVIYARTKVSHILLVKM